MFDVDKAIEYLKRMPGTRYMPEELYRVAQISGKYSSLERSLRRRVVKNDLPIEPRLIGLRNELRTANNGQKITHYYWG